MTFDSTKQAESFFINPMNQRVNQLKIAHKTQEFPLKTRVLESLNLYQAIDPNNLSSLEKLKENIQEKIKMSSYTATHYYSEKMEEMAYHYKEKLKKLLHHINSLHDNYTTLKKTHTAFKEAQNNVQSTVKLFKDIPSRIIKSNVNIEEVTETANTLNIMPFNHLFKIAQALDHDYRDIKPDDLTEDVHNKYRALQHIISTHHRLRKITAEDNSGGYTRLMERELIDHLRLHFKKIALDANNL